MEYQARCRRFHQVPPCVFWNLFAQVLQELHRPLPKQLLKSTKTGKGPHTHKRAENLNDNSLFRRLGGQAGLNIKWRSWGTSENKGEILLSTLILLLCWVLKNRRKSHREFYKKDKTWRGKNINVCWGVDKSAQEIRVWNWFYGTGRHCINQNNSWSIRFGR